MKISEVAKKYGLTTDTLRYYEAFGLIDRINKVSGIRVYSDTDLERIEFILCMKNAGLSLEEIKVFIGLAKMGDETIDKRIELLEKHKKLLEEEIKAKTNTLDYLNKKIKYYKEYK